MLNINTNLSSLIAQNSLKQSSTKLNTAIERMSTGCKINHAKDNAANYSISTNMTTKIGAYQVAEDNALQGLDMINTASESLTLIEDKLMRLRALAEQSANGTYGAQSKQAINQEANAIVDEIERLYFTTEYNGISLLDSNSEVIGPKLSEHKDVSSYTKLSEVDATQEILSGKYSISSVAELIKLAEMTNTDKIKGGEFVLNNDIDLSGVAWTTIGRVNSVTWEKHTFTALFDGNGYTISNLESHNVNGEFVGLFGATTGGEIRNLKIKDFNISAFKRIGGLVGYATGNTKISDVVVESCELSCVDWGALLVGYASEVDVDRVSVSGSIISSQKYIGGVIGAGYNYNLNNIKVLSNIEGTEAVAGLVGWSENGVISNIRSNSVVVASNSFGGVVGNNQSDLEISNAQIAGKIINLNAELGGQFVGKTNADIRLVNSSYTGVNRDLSKCSQFSIGTSLIEEVLNNSFINLQVGINSLNTAQILLNTGCLILGLSDLRQIGSGASGYLTMLDDMLLQLSEKQTELGAVQNRLESVVEEIGIQYDNLISSRSTLRDADIAEVSAEYIQQQILQQASATLLATANQSPSIALQLI